MAILCLAGSKTRELVLAEARRNQLTVRFASSTEEARALLTDTSWIALVAAMGTQPANLLLDGMLSSSLLEAAKATQLACARIVFSHTAHGSAQTAELCRQAYTYTPGHVDVDTANANQLFFGNP